MLGTRRRKIAAISIWLQLGAFGYLFVSEELSCVGVRCRPWALDTGLEWIVINAVIYVVPTVLGVLLWRGSMVGAILAILGGILEIFVCGFFALIFLYGAGWGFYPFWVVALAPLVVPGELAIVTLFLVVIALIRLEPLPTPAHATSRSAIQR
jgi:hypothetical protein